LFIKDLKISNFKNYEQENALFSSAFNIVVGLNGMGKTNLLDAIYYLCIGKSYFTTRDLNVVSKGKEFFRLQANFDRNKDFSLVVAKVVPGKTKEIKRNSITYDRLIDHVGYLPVVIISPRDIQLFYEGSEERRKFLDYSISQYDKEYLRQLSVYNKLLKQRNAALKQFAKEQHVNKALLAAYNAKMLEPALYINKMRNDFVKELSPIFNSCYASISNEAESCQCTYKSQLTNSDFGELLRVAEPKDIVLQRTSVGTHKDDLSFFMNDSNLKTFGSQGQLKTFVLALKLAQYEMLFSHTSFKPILLLDDLFDKLDNKRVLHLLKLLSSDTFGQVFISDTHEEKLKELFAELKLDYSCLRITNGSIEKTS
jgi:DNA replication and repair protein RecF